MPKPTRQALPVSAALRRRNLWTAGVLAAMATLIMLSVFGWRYVHHEAPMPQGSAYGNSYVIVPEATPLPAPAATTETPQ